MLMPRLVDVLQTLGASRQRDGTWSIDLAALQLGSLFGGDLEGVGAFSIQADSIVFKSPAELAACGALWLPDVQDDDALCQSIALAIDDLKQQTRASLTTLRRLGFKARIVAPEPHARGAMQIDGVSVGVLIDSNGHLVVDEVGGRAITSTQRRSLMAPDEATPAEALQLVATMARLASVADEHSLSQEELDELQAALGDDDLDLDDSDDDAPLSSDEAEPTMAGVPPPMRSPGPPPLAIDDDEDDDDQGTLEVVVTGKATVRHGADASPSDAPHQAARSALLDEFDDQEVAPGDVAPDDDDDDDLSPPTAELRLTHKLRGSADPGATVTRPAFGIAGAVPEAHRSLHRDPRADDLGGDGDKARAWTMTPAFDDVPGTAGHDASFASTVTEINQGLRASPHPPPVFPTTAYQRSGQLRGGNVGQPHVDDDFDIETTGTVSPNRVPATDDDFDDGKTKALVVDEALLARLKAGDFAASGFQLESADPLPAVALKDARHRDDGGGMNVHFDDDDFELASTSVIGAGDKTMSPSQLGARHTGHTIGVGPPGSSDDGSVSSQLREAYDFDVGTANLKRPLSMEPFEIAAKDDQHDHQELQQLESRAIALETELAAVHNRILVLRAALEVTGSLTATARSAARPMVGLPPALPMPEPPRVGDSDDGSEEGGTAPEPDIDVHEMRGAEQNSLLDELHDDNDNSDDFSGAGIVMTNDAVGDAADSEDPDDIGFAEAIEADDSPAHDEELVSLAALQGALKEMGVDLNEVGETQVAASVMPFQLNDDGGDVFGNGSGSDHLSSQLSERAVEMSKEATRVRVSRPSSIALVVEDERARVRLRKHLVDRFSELLEADDANAALHLDGISDVDAIVFVRPRHDDACAQGFSRLGGLPHRPRVLVISQDDAFDDVVAVDLRLPLAQRASEVAQQILDGLERLGLQLTPIA
jgi:hypothetical protein